MYATIRNNHHRKVNVFVHLMCSSYCTETLFVTFGVSSLNFSDSLVSRHLSAFDYHTYFTQNQFSNNFFALNR